MRHVWQVFTLQYMTELTFIAIKPFTLEFATMLASKAVLHITIKGGLLLKLHAKLSEWYGSAIVSHNNPSPTLTFG